MVSYRRKKTLEIKSTQELDMVYSSETPFSEALLLVDTVMHVNGTSA